MMSQSQPVDFGPGRPVVFRNATVLTMDPSSGVLRDGDVLVTDQRIAAVGTGLAVPDGTAEIDASGGILMPGMVDALQEVPGRFVLAYGNLLGAPWEWSKSPEFRDFVARRMDGRGDMLGMQLAFDVPGDPSFPEQGAFESARELGLTVTT